MENSDVRICTSESDMRAMGILLAEKLHAGSVMTLTGELGAGKSVLARSVIHALGHVGYVKSPTYTLVETYHLKNANRQGIQKIAHLDLYRLSDADELYFLGLDDILSDNDLIIIEWPENGKSLLPEPTVQVQIDYADAGSRSVTLNFEKD